jgi:hypothetical protein
VSAPGPLSITLLLMNSSASYNDRADCRIRVPRGWLEFGPERAGRLDDDVGDASTLSRFIAAMESAFRFACAA